MTKRVLLVDDEPDVRSLYKKILEKGGYEVKAVKDGFTALDAVEKFKPHIIVLDIMMPRLDGWEVAKRIRKNHNRLELPIVMLTVKTEIEDKVKSVGESGANRHLAKPVEGSQLIATIRTLLDEI